MTGPGNNQQGNFNKPISGPNAPGVQQQFKPASPAIQQQNRPGQVPPAAKQMIPQQVKPVPQVTQAQPATPTPAPQQPRLKPILKQTTTPAAVAQSAPPPSTVATSASPVAPIPPAAVSEASVEDGKESMEVDQNQEQSKWKRNRLPGCEYKVCFFFTIDWWMRGM